MIPAFAFTRTITRISLSPPRIKARIIIENFSSNERSRLDTVRPETSQGNWQKPQEAKWEIRRKQSQKVIGTASLATTMNGQVLDRNPRTGARPLLMLKADVVSLSMILLGHGTIRPFQ
jgi:hypothetical protein